MLHALILGCARGGFLSTTFRIQPRVPLPTANPATWAIGTKTVPMILNSSLSATKAVATKTLRVPSDSPSRFQYPIFKADAVDFEKSIHSSMVLF